MSSNVFFNNTIARCRQNAQVFNNVQQGDKLRWENDNNGSYIPKIDKAGWRQGLTRTYAFYVRGDMEAEGIQASRRAIEFANSFKIKDIRGWPKYQNIITKQNQENKTHFPFEAIKRAFVTLSCTYNTVGSRWGKDSDETARDNYFRAATIMNPIVCYENLFMLSAIKPQEGTNKSEVVSGRETCIFTMEGIPKIFQLFKDV